MDHEAKSNFDFACDFESECVWYARPQLYFNCSFRRCLNCAPIECSMVYYSAFDNLELQIQGHMESAGVKMLYEPSGKKYFFCGLVSDMIGRVPLVPCFIHGNTTPTIPHEYSSLQRTRFNMGRADSLDGNIHGSSVYEVNLWIWQFGRGRPRIGGLSVEKTDEKRKLCRTQAALASADTRKRRAENQPSSRR